MLYGEQVHEVDAMSMSDIFSRKELLAVPPAQKRLCAGFHMALSEASPGHRLPHLDFPGRILLAWPGLSERASDAAL